MAQAIRTETLTRDRLEVLAGRRDTTVMETEYETPDVIIPPKHQLDICADIMKAFDAACVALPGADDETLREIALGTETDRRTWQSVYAKTFVLITRRAQTAEDREELDGSRKLLVRFILQAMGDGYTEETKASMMNMAFRMCIRDSVPADVAEGPRISLATAPGVVPPPPAESGDGTAPSPSPYMRLDHSELGHTLVHQGPLPSAVPAGK